MLQSMWHPRGVLGKKRGTTMEGFKKALQDKNGKIYLIVLVVSIAIMLILGLFHIDHWMSVTIPGIISLIATDRFVALVNYYNSEK